ncbi:MAG: metallophosphoesterase family protein, partial [Actinobacteria bacterium]
MPAENPEAAHDACVGLISDTHGRLDARVIDVFEAAGVSAIVHAGDVGGAEVLYALEAVAPVTAV